MRQQRLIKQLTIGCLLSALAQVSANAASTVSKPAPGDFTPDKTTVFTPVFTKYIDTCKDELGFDEIPAFACTEINYRPSAQDGTLANGFVSHRVINDDVDAVFACTAVSAEKLTARTAQMIIHNRANGKTCFLQMANQGTSDNPVIDISQPVSPTEGSAFLTWDTPNSTAQNRCTDCHSAGPYIASSPIVFAMAQFGLINDGHDVMRTSYSAVGSIADVLNSNAEQSLQSKNCGSACHLLGGRSRISGPKVVLPLWTTGNPQIYLVPSINTAIDELTHPDDPASNRYGMNLQEHMPPTDAYSDYRWINRDRPGSDGDYERLSDVKREFPQFYCSNPQALQAREIDRSEIISTEDFPDLINTFNLYDGLICLNADQPAGTCANYETRYRCGSKWTAWKSADRPNASGDYERRSSDICANASRIQARFTAGNGTKSSPIEGPRDRLLRFNTDGLICRHKDQPEGESCHNYAVRFICP
jgi:hypothetical protein